MKTYLTAAIVAAATMTAIEAQAAQPTYQLMQQVCDGFNKTAATHKDRTQDCVPYNDGVWVTIQGRWNYNNSQDALDAKCNKFLAMGMQEMSFDRFAIKITQIDNRERSVTSFCTQERMAEASQPTEPTTSRITISYTRNLGYVTDKGTINGDAARFVIDTGASGTSINGTYFNGSGAIPVGSAVMTLADGSTRREIVYRVRNICVATMCADSLDVTFENDEAPNLLGVDFFQAAHVSLAIKDGMMTLAAR